MNRSVKSMGGVLLASLLLERPTTRHRLLFLIILWGH